MRKDRPQSLILCKQFNRSLRYYFIELRIGKVPIEGFNHAIGLTSSNLRFGAVHKKNNDKQKVVLSRNIEPLTHPFVWILLVVCNLHAT